MAKTNVLYKGDPRVFEVAMHGCEFVGLVYEKAAGDCDIYIRLWDSEFDGMDIQRITDLRKRGDQNKEIFAGELSGSILNPLTVWRAKNVLREWLQHNFGLEYGLRDQAKEFIWKVASFLRHAPSG